MTRLYQRRNTQVMDLNELSTRRVWPSNPFEDYYCICSRINFSEGQQDLTLFYVSVTSKLLVLTCHQHRGSIVW